ncbi:MAG TPA: hypothetical protein PLJ58_03605 [bacterium]|nr:hypothetical protein [bacterium]
MSVTTNSVSKIIKAEALTRALGILSKAHGNDKHDPERYKSIVTVVDAIIKEDISLEQLRSYHITCSRCLATIRKDLGNELDSAVLFVVLNYSKVDERIFSRLALIERFENIGQDYLMQRDITLRCYELIKVQIKYLVVEEAYRALQKIPNWQFLINSGNHLIRVLEDYDTPSKNLSFIRSAVSSRFLTADEIVEICTDDEAKEAFEKKIYQMPEEQLIHKAS